MRRWLNRLGLEVFFRLLQVKRADTMGQARELARDRLAQLDQLQETAEALIAEGQCFTLKDLAVHGRDVLAAGISPGPEVGRTLNSLLEKVLNGELPNDRQVLLEQLRPAPSPAAPCPPLPGPCGEFPKSKCL